MVQKSLFPKKVTRDELKQSRHTNQIYLNKRE